MAPLWASSSIDYPQDEHGINLGQQPPPASRRRRRRQNRFNFRLTCPLETVIFCLLCDFMDYFARLNYIKCDGHSMLPYAFLGGFLRQI